MKEDSNKTISIGVTFGNLLQIAFIVLKLCKVIDWSWWWVLSPMWISAGLVALIFAIMILIYWLKG